MAPTRIPVLGSRLALAAILVACFSVPALSLEFTICPSLEGSWCSSGVSGALYDGRQLSAKKEGTINMLYHYKPNADGLGQAGVPNAATCQQLCKDWMNSPELNSVFSGNSGEACVYWTWGQNSADNCILYDQYACQGPATYVKVVGESGMIASTVSGTIGGGSSKCAPPSVSGDPHFIGADNSHFDFTGTPNRHYCMVSDSHLHINAYMGGRYGQWGENPHKALTWIRQVGILWGHHTILLAAREGASWQYDAGYMARIEIDGRPVQLASQGDRVKTADQIQVTWTAARLQSADDLVDVYEVKIGSALHMKLTLRPEVENLRTEEDGVVHINMEFKELPTSHHVHGVLGQTYRSDHFQRLSNQKLEFNEQLQVDMVPGENAEGFLDGTPEDYESSDILRADCRFARFIRASSVDSESAFALELKSASASADSSVQQSRRLLRGSAAILS